jgi:crotonobetainyl-CoA:carnitine CoA-transferase CaiB-like acyl-CoA transferase
MSQSREMATGPLQDIRVVDLTQALAGPFCTMLLADLGADVIKVESPRGDFTRGMPPYPEDPQACDYGGYFASINRNKRSICLDIKEEADRAVLFRLVESADAFVENSRAGVMDRLGVGYEVLRERNPRLVYAAIRGFGDPRTGESPYVDWPAFDVVAQAMGGLVGTTGPPEASGYPAGASVGDLFPGSLAALGIVSAVHSARRTGEGQFMDVAMYDAILLMCEQMVYHYSYDARIAHPKGRGHQSLCPFDVFDTSDGAVAIAAPTPHHWGVLCALIGRVDLIEDPRTHDNIARVQHRDIVTEAISAWTTQHTKAEIVAEFAGRVPVGPVNTVADIFNDPHVQARQMLADIDLPGNDRPVQIAAQALKFAATPAGVYRRPPLLDEHREEVLAEIGLTLEEAPKPAGVPFGMPGRKRTEET